jgi:hypothetical protein
MLSLSCRKLAIAVAGLAIVSFTAADRAVAQNCGFSGSCTTTFAEVVDVSGSDPALQPALDDYMFDTDIGAFVAQVEADVGQLLLGPYGISVETEIFSQIGIGDPESPDFIVLHTDFLETTTATFALTDPPWEPYSGTSTTTFQSIVDVTSSEPFLQPALSAYTIGDDIDAFVAQLETNLSQQLLGTYGITVVRIVINLIGIGDPESPDFIALHADYLILTTASFALHRSIIPEPSTALLLLMSAACGAARHRRPRAM